MENERTFSAPPTDGVSALRFGTDGERLLVSSWDSALRLYDVATDSVLTCLLQPAPLLDCDLLPDGQQAVSAGLDGAIRLHGLASGKESTLGLHEGSVRCVRHSGAANVVVSGSWDRSLKLWDTRASAPCVGTHALPGKVLSLCAGAPTAGAPPLLVVATSGRHVHVIDLRKPLDAMQKRESSLKGQTRCVAQMPSGEGYALGSVEGRVAIEYIDPSPAAQEKKYAFKCHRAAVDAGDGVYPVNAIAFHPRHGTFASGGCDGVVNVWDAALKKRLSQFRRYPTSIAALAFSPAGDAIAIAASYTFEQGDRDRAPDAIHVRRLSDMDCRPKARAAAASSR